MEVKKGVFSGTKNTLVSRSLILTRIVLLEKFRKTFTTDVAQWFKQKFFKLYNLKLLSKKSLLHASILLDLRRLWFHSASLEGKVARLHLPFICRILIFFQLFFKTSTAWNDSCSAQKLCERTGKKTNITLIACHLHNFLCIFYLGGTWPNQINPKAPWLKNVLNFSVSREWILHHTANVQPWAGVHGSCRVSCFGCDQQISSQHPEPSIHLFCFFPSCSPLQILCYPQLHLLLLCLFF